MRQQKGEKQTSAWLKRHGGNMASLQGSQEKACQVTAFCCRPNCIRVSQVFRTATAFLVENTLFKFAVVGSGWEEQR